MLIHCKNNASHCKINDICIAWILNHYKNNTIHCKINDIYIYMSMLLYSYKITCMYASPDCDARISAFSNCVDFNPILPYSNATQHSSCFSSLILNVQCNGRFCTLSGHKTVPLRQNRSNAMLIVLMQMQANPNTSKQIQANQQYIYNVKLYIYIYIYHTHIHI